MSSICPRFVQNAWRKDLCSNCFKSKEEHANLQTVKKHITLPPLPSEPPKGIIKKSKKDSSKRNVSFHKELSEVIGFGGEWSENDDSDHDEFDDHDHVKHNPEEHAHEDPDPELIRITKTNTDFNMNNQNLLGHPEGNIKKTFASLKLGASQPKQPLQITVLPFGSTNKVSDMKQKFNSTERMKPFVTNTIPIQTNANNNSITNIKTKTDDISPKEKEDSNKLTQEKTLLEEISETLEKNNLLKDNQAKQDLTSSPTLSNTTSASMESKRSLQRHNPIKKDQAKPKIFIFPKHSNNSESSDGGNSSDDNNLSAYYDVVCDNSYENILNEDLELEEKIEEIPEPTKNINLTPSKKKSSFFSSQLISDMFLSKKPISEHLRKRTETYNLSDRSYMTSKITSDGLIVTKNTSEDALDSSGSSFDSSSDEEMSSMNRSESDSGIGICVSTEYQNLDQEIRIKEFNGYEQKPVVAKTLSNSDYEDVHVDDEMIIKDEKIFSPEKSRELAGEPDGRSDPDGSAEAPALPTSPPPNIDARKSFLHGLQQQKSLEKPKVPTKPTVSVIKTFAKRPQNIVQQQVIMQLQQVIKPTKNESAPVEKTTESIKINGSPKLDDEIYKSAKKGRAPNPPPSPTKEEISNSIIDRETPSPTSSSTLSECTSECYNHEKSDKSTDSQDEPIITTPTSLYMRKQNLNIKSTSPVVREKDKRERATVNPKFRSLNTFSTNRSSLAEKSRSTTPEPAPRKSLSLSQDSLHNSADLDKKKKNKFSIKKFLRMGNNNKTTDSSFNGNKKDGFYGEQMNSSSNNDENNSPQLPQTKPRLVIIHPLDINNTGVEVIKDLKSTTPDSTPNTLSLMSTANINITNNITNMSNSISSTPTTPTTITGKPPAPPQRSNFDGNRGQDTVKPARPPPPKSAELRRKQKFAEKRSPDAEKDNNKMDNVYANLGEVRSAIAPRKPERTASMRGEKDGSFELPRRRPIGQYENVTLNISSAASDTSSQIDTISKESDISECDSVPIVSRTSSDASDLSFKKMNIIINNNNSNNNNNSIDDDSASLYSSFNKRKLMDFEKSDLSAKTMLSDGIKNSVQKMSSTIDSYLKDRMSSSAPSTMIKTQSSQNLRTQIDVELRSNLSFDIAQLNSVQRSSLPDHSGGGSIYGGSSIAEKSDFRKSEDIYSKKYTQANLPRAISMSYCGSEIGAESEIYSPYSFYSSEAGTDVALGDPQDGWGSQQSSKSRSGKTINRLRMRKGRSVVHKNLEDNYGAVVVANHEALAQVLDQMQQTTNIPIHLRPIANSINLRFEDFSLNEGARGVVVGRRAFHSALWSNHIQITLALTADCNQMSGVGGELNQLSGGISGALNPIAEFCDLVPSHYLPLMPSTQVRMIQSTISILPRMHIDTIQSIGSILKAKSANPTTNSAAFGGSIPNLSAIKEQKPYSRNGNSVQNLTTMCESIDEDCATLGSSVSTAGITNSIGLSNFEEVLFREVGFIMLQLINGLKNLQVKGIEEMPLSLSSIVLCREVENKEAQARLCVLQSLNQDLGREEEEPMGTLCQCANTALISMLPYTKYTNILSKILLQEKSDSLSKAKSILEYAIWGPSDVLLTGSTKERELALQRWLDLERATVLHGLVRTRVELTVYDECHLMFLVRSNAKIMNEASNILTSSE